MSLPSGIYSNFANTFGAAGDYIDFAQSTTTATLLYTSRIFAPVAGAGAVSLRLVSDISMGSTTITMSVGGVATDTDTQTPPAGVPGAVFTLDPGTLAIGDELIFELTTVTISPATIVGYVILSYP